MAKKPAPSTRNYADWKKEYDKTVGLYKKATGAEKAKLQKQVSALQGELKQIRAAGKMPEKAPGQAPETAPGQAPGQAGEMTTDEAFMASLQQIFKTDPQLYNAIVGSMGLGRQMEQEMLATQLSEELPQKLQDLENEATKQYEASGTVDPLTQKAIDRVAKEMETAGQMTPAQTEAIAMMKERLGGYTSPELQAMREQTLRSVGEEADVKTQQLLGKLGARNIQGGVAGKLGGNIALQAMLARGNLESKLLAENAAVQDERMKLYAGTLGEYQDISGRQRLSALDIFSRTNLQAGENLATRRQNAFNTMADIRGKNVGYTTGIQQENRAIQREGLAQRYSLPLSMGQLYTGNQQYKDQLQLAKENIETQRQANRAMVEAAKAGAGGGGGGWSIPPPEPGFDQPSATPAPTAGVQGAPASQGLMSQQQWQQGKDRYNADLRDRLRKDPKYLTRPQPKSPYSGDYQSYVNQFNDQGGGGLT